ncbi:reverse transcriptase domain-containing protein [Streptomyces sp. NPDC026589]|uniref:reverse transcriptase domain-containing protein n=1 Tax=Streptomyces sp. NPDC026589 TaxID=3155609 RepID=UPI0033C8FF41
MYLETTGQHLSVRRPALVHKHTREGFLPQGAPTSGYLSNIVMRDVDEVVSHRAESLRLRYTRYSDDMYFSSRGPVPHDRVDRLVAEVKRAMEPLDMRLNAKKTYVARPGARRSVLGIVVDGPTPRLTRAYKRRITMHVRGAASFGVVQHCHHQKFGDLAELDAHVTGLLSFAHMVEPGWAGEQLATWKRLREIPLEHEEPVIAQYGLDLPWHEEVEVSQADLAKASIDVDRRSRPRRPALSLVRRLRADTRVRRTLQTVRPVQCDGGPHPEAGRALRPVLLGVGIEVPAGTQTRRPTAVDLPAPGALHARVRRRGHRSPAGSPGPAQGGHLPCVGVIAGR